MGKRFGLLFLLSVITGLVLFSCTKRKPEEVDYAPNSPWDPYPPDSATNVEHTTLDVTLRWTATDPNSGDALIYDLYLDTLDPPESKIASGLTASSYFLTGLSYNTTYHWRLYITDDKGVTTSGPVWRFTTLPHANSAPAAPVYLYPADNAPLQYPTLDFALNCSDPEGDSDTLYYDLYLGVTTQPPISLFRDDPANTWEFTGLEYTTAYYWRVAVRDNHYAYNTGPIYSFTTRDCPWFYKRELPSPRYGFGTAVVNNKIYVIGGTDGMNPLSEVLEYDPATDAWTRKAAMPTARSNLAVAVWNGKIYALGGKDIYDLRSSNEVYDPAMDIWSSLDPLPNNGCNPTSAHAVKGVIYTLDPVMAYTVAADDWWDTALVFYDTAWTDTTMTVFDSVIVDTVYSYVKSSRPHESVGHCSAVYNNLIYVMGGSQGSVQLPYVDVYHPGTNDWSAARDMIGPAAFSAATTANGFIYAIGGYDGSYSKRVRKYDPLSDAWFIRSDLQTGRSYLGTAYSGVYIYAIGGISPFSLSTVEEYRLELDPKR